MCVSVERFGGGGRREVETEILSLDLVGEGFSAKAGLPAQYVLSDDLYRPSLGKVESLD